MVCQRARRSVALAPGPEPMTKRKIRLSGFYDARTGMPSGMPEGAMCVQRFDDSLNSAIHTTYRISLRSSSMREPRDPLLKVLTFFCVFPLQTDVKKNGKRVSCPRPKGRGKQSRGRYAGVCSDDSAGRARRRSTTSGTNYFFNDPSAGSPTETLLRLLLPLNDQV